MNRDDQQMDALYDALRNQQWQGPLPHARPAATRRRRWLHPRASLVAALFLSTMAWMAAVAFATGSGERMAERVWLSLNLDSLSAVGPSSITVSGDLVLRLNTEHVGEASIQVLLDADGAGLAPVGGLSVTDADGVVSPIVLRRNASGELELQVGRAPCPDIDVDGYVNGADMSHLLARFGDACICAADANGDGVIDIEDIRYVARWFGPWPRVDDEP